jgi:hypothetical protein
MFTFKLHIRKKCLGGAKAQRNSFAPRSAEAGVGQGKIGVHSQS